MQQFLIPAMASFSVLIPWTWLYQIKNIISVHLSYGICTQCDLVLLIAGQNVVEIVISLYLNIYKFNQLKTKPDLNILILYAFSKRIFNKLLGMVFIDLRTSEC